ncbi:MAG TPA: hypothetical protein PLL19_13430 [Thiobacillaceae bacterium]|nr:hypothetical protein [Thiobacillaceae bacterium]HNH89708.1 hypothetical protein [Thiobacillaceae bacterium]
MKRFKQFWKSLQGASYGAQLGLIAGAYLAFYLILFVLISHITWSFAELPPFTERVAKVTAFLFLDSGEAPEVNAFWSLLNKLGLLLLTAFSSSLFTSKMISHQSNLRFSKPLAYYSRAIIDSEQSRFPGEYLVFRLLNESEDDLYNVRVSATLRYYHAPTRTFQHYTCNVLNATIPVLGSQMPFRMYVAMGEVASAIYRKRLSFTETGEEIINLAALQAEIAAGARPADADQMILYVEGIDSGEGKLTTAAHRYALAAVREGKFASIEPRRGEARFDPTEVKRLFDVAEAKA